MQYLDLVEQVHSDTGPFPFTQLSAKFKKQRHNIGPLNARRGWAGKNQIKSSS